MSSQSPPTPRRHTLVNVQILRFLAAAMVLFAHLEHEADGPRMRAAAPFTGFNSLDWGLGVDIFFVISGFIMIYMTADRFGAPGASGDFLRRRVARVAPTYWFFTTLMLGAAVAVPALVAHGSLDLSYLLASYAFVPLPRADGMLRPVLALGWTLNYEMAFYVCFAAALLLPLRRGLVALAAAFSALVLVVAALGPMLPAPVAFWGDPIILEFLGGIGLGLLFRRGWRIGLPAALALALGGIGLAVLFDRPDFHEDLHRVVTGGLPALPIAAAFILCRAEPAEWLGRVAVLGGDASYVLYLSHPFSISALAVGWSRVLPGHPWPFVVAGFAVATAAAIAFHLTVEKLLHAPADRRRPASTGLSPVPS